MPDGSWCDEMLSNVNIGLFAVISVLLVFQLASLSSSPTSSALLYSASPEPATAVQHPWQYQSEIHARNHALSYERCDAAFPELWFEIDRAAAFWHDRGHAIQKEDVNIDRCHDACTRVLIYDNELRIIETKKTYKVSHTRKRTQAVLSQIHRALLGATAIGESVPNAEFSFSVADVPPLPRAEIDNHTVWTFARQLQNRQHDKLWVMPDFNFWAWSPAAGSFHDMQSRARAHDAQLSLKIPKVMWRGALYTNEALRGALLAAAEGQPWSDVVPFRWKTRENFVRLEDMCRYMFLVHTEGHSWSGRLKYLLNCDSVPIIHHLGWTASTYHLLKSSGPEQNFVSVKRDFSDLQARMEWYLEHVEEAQQIVTNSITTFRSRYSTPAAEACYWRRMFRAWRAASFEPEPYENVQVNISGVTEIQKQPRGLGFELFIGFEGDWPVDDPHYAPLSSDGA